MAEIKLPFGFTSRLGRETVRLSAHGEALLQRWFTIQNNRKACDVSFLNFEFC
jgi:alpha-mannosidase